MNNYWFIFLILFIILLIFIITVAFVIKFLSKNIKKDQDELKENLLKDKTIHTFIGFRRIVGLLMVVPVAVVCYLLTVSSYSYYIEQNYAYMIFTMFFAIMSLWWILLTVVSAGKSIMDFFNNGD